MRKRLFCILSVLSCIGLLTVFAYAADKPIITITAGNQSLPYGQKPVQGDCEIVLPDGMNPNWYEIDYSLTADYVNKQINVSNVKIISDNLKDVTDVFQIMTKPGVLIVQQTNLTAGSDTSAQPIEYGQTLGNSSIVGEMGYQSNGSFEPVQGKWTWDNPSVCPTVSGDSWRANFTVTDETMKAYFLPTTAELLVEIKPATPSITISAPAAVVSGQTVDLTVAAVNPHDSSLSAPTPSVTYRIGNAAAKTVQNSRFVIPADTPEGTVIVVTASTPEVSGQYAAASESVTLTVEELRLDDAMVTLDTDACSYDGTPQTPGVTVTVGGRTLAVGEDYTVSYADNIEVGEAKVTIYGRGDYSGTVTKQFSIEKAVLTVTAQKQSLPYGRPLDQSYVQLAFPEEIDRRAYTVSCILSADSARGVIEVSEVKVTCGQLDVTGNFEIICMDGTLEIYRSKPIYQTPPTASAIRYGESLSASTITGEMGYRDESGEFVPLKGEWKWDNAASCPESVHDSHRAYFHVTDTALADYFDVFSVDLQVALVSVSPKIALSVPPYAMSGQTVSVEVSVSNPINGDKPGPVPAVTYQIGDGAVQTAVGNRILIPVGTPDGTCVTITAETAACADQYGSARATAWLTVRQIDLSGAIVTLSAHVFNYDGNAQTPAVTVVLDGKQLTANADYTVSYADNIRVGTASVTVSGIGCYMGGVGASFVIQQGTPSYTAPATLTAVVGQTLAEVKLPTNWAWAEPETTLTQIGSMVCEAIYTPVDPNYHGVTVPLSVIVKARSFTVSLSQTSFVYDGDVQKPIVNVSAGVTALIEREDYSVAWPVDCTNVGTKTILVTGQGDYTDTVTVTYTIERADAAAAHFAAVLDEADAVYSGAVKKVMLRCDEAYTGYGEITVTCRQAGSTEPAAPLHAGTYHVLLTMTGGVNFNAITTPIEIGTVTIQPRPLTVTAIACGKRFGEAEPELPYSAPELLGNDRLSGAPVREAGEQIGTYAIRQGTLGNPDYAITFIGADFTIGKASAPAAPAVNGRTSLANDAYTYTIDAISGGEYRMDDGDWQSGNVFAGIRASSTHRFSARVAGTASAEVGEIGSRMVTFDRVSGSAEVRIVGWTYGQSANAPVPVSATNGTSDVHYLYKAAEAADAAYTADVPTDAGCYTIKAVFAGNEQYTEAAVTADFTIAKAELTVTAATAVGRRYEQGSAAAAVTAVMLEGILPADIGMVAVDCTALTGILPGENAGVYTEICLPVLSLIGARSGNYTLIQPTGAVATHVTIAKADAPTVPTMAGTPAQTGDGFIYTVDAVDGAEYRMDAGEWQDSPVFNGLAAGSTHTFFTRIKGTANVDAGEVCCISVTFDRVPGSASVSLAGWAYGEAPNMPVPVSATNGTANVTYLYKAAGADDSTYTPAVPTVVGHYTVKANFAGTVQYFPVTAEADFSITKDVIPQVCVDVSAPVAGAMPQQTITAGAAWTGTIAWTPAITRFAYDTVYTVTVILTADENHRFADTTAAEGFIVMPDGDDRLILTKTFAATQKAAGTASEPVAMVYNGAAVDVSQLFAITANADAAVYTIIGGTGEGALAGSQLSVTKAGTFEVAVDIPAIGQYAAFRATAVLTVERGTAAAAIVGRPDADTVIRVGDVFTLNVDGADGRTVFWSATGPAEVADGVVTVTGAGEITVTAAIAANAVCAAQTLTYTFIGEETQTASPIRIPIATIVVEAGEGGRISHSGRNLVVYGSSHTFTVMPDAGYRIVDVLVNGVSVGAVETVTVCAKGVLCHVEAVFSPELVPSVPATRAEIAEILWQLEGCPMIECAAEFFDVSAEQWYADAISWAVANGIINGYGNGLYGPNDPITREQAAAIFGRYAAYCEGNNAANDDSGGRDWAAKAMEWAERIGLFAGVTRDTSDPAAAVNCAELAAYLRAFGEGLQ
ncbi:MAG: S-layer homology domain-containing protein [Clostridia bacterium]|nr:S-layer homology domain-containing protein [Clostridia bacterium]